MVKDIRPGVEGSYPYGLVAWNGAPYFTADDGVHGWEMWRSDGTAAGTTLLKDINPGPADSNAELFAPLSGALLIQAATDDYGWELWRTDGTAAGTVLVKDIRPGPDDASLKYPAVMNNVAYFNEDDGSGPGLWRTDGSDAGTYLVSPALLTNLLFTENSRGQQPGGQPPLCLRGRWPVPTDAWLAGGGCGRGFGRDLGL